MHGVAHMRQRVAQAAIEVEVAKLNNWRTLTRIARGEPLGPESSFVKLYWSEMSQRMHDTVMQAMGQAIAKRDMDAYLGLSETLLMLMRQHNMKEEQILYPMSDQALADTASDLVRQMDALPV